MMDGEKAQQQERLFDAKDGAQRHLAADTQGEQHKMKVQTVVWQLSRLHSGEAQRSLRTWKEEAASDCYSLAEGVY